MTGVNPGFARPYSFRKLIAGAQHRKTRLHDEHGRLVSLSRALRNGPRAVATGLGRVVFGFRPELPWISYDAQAVLSRFLTRDSQVLEFGSGMSTLWYGRKAGRVVSVEDHQEWYDIVAPRLQAMGNVDYRFASSPEAYPAMGGDDLYDLSMIDGSWRHRCAEFAVTHLKPGGVIYLDNCDKGVDAQRTGDVPQAVRTLMEFAEREGLPTREFTDFAPTQLFVQRGLMIGPPAT